MFSIIIKSFFLFLLDTVGKLNGVIKTGVKVDVQESEWVPGSKISVKVDVEEGKSIRNIVIWAESVDSEQPGMHIGSWSPISAHAYVDGCNGPANTTVTNAVDLNGKYIFFFYALTL